MDFNKKSTPKEKKELQSIVNEWSKNLEVKPNKRYKGNTWFIPYETITTKKKKGFHPATFPVKLVEDCIKFSGKTKGILLDPFMGTGTSAVGALNQGLDYIGFEIDKDNIEFANKRLGEL